MNKTRSQSFFRLLSSVSCLPAPTLSGLSARRKAFSLIEIVIALAVISLGLIAVVGLIPQGTQAARGTTDGALAATITQDTFNQMRVIASTAGGGWPPSWPSTWYPNAYYDSGGTSLVSQAAAYYHVNLSAQSSALVPNLVTVVAIVSWPAQSATPLNAVTNFTQIANYQN